jgi:hypothetical protein
MNPLPQCAFGYAGVSLQCFQVEPFGLAGLVSHGCSCKIPLCSMSTTPWSSVSLLSYHRADKTAGHGQNASDGDIPADVQRSRLPLPGADDLPEWAAGKECKTSSWILFQNHLFLEHAFCRLPGTWAEQLTVAARARFLERRSSPSTTQSFLHKERNTFS